MRTAPEIRFWARVDKSGDCWMWRGSRRRDGYGVIHVHGKMLMTHRYSFMLANGPIPAGSLVMHSCDVPACVNPAHLRLGSHFDNTLDAALKGRMRGPQKPRPETKARRARVAELLSLLGTRQAVAEVLGISIQRVGQLLAECNPTVT